MWYQRVSKDENVFMYVDVDTQDILTNEKEIDRINHMRIPKAYHGVMVSKNPRSKVQAYGYDSKERKQVMYASWFLEKQSAKKFEKVFELDKIMPSVLNRMKTDIEVDKTSGNMKNRGIAVLLYLMLACGFRIGNEKYATTNKSYGLTTLEVRHVKVRKAKHEIEIRFIGKKGVENNGIVRKDQSPLVYKYLVKAIKGKSKNEQVFDSISSEDVNEYLRSISPHITSKDLRTWNANNIFLSRVLQKANECDLQGDGVRESRKVLLEAIKEAANHLHHTRDVCKKNYLHPSIVEYAEIVVVQPLLRPNISHAVL